MKHTKTIVICAAFLLVAMGGLMIAAAAVRGDFDMENIKGISYEMKTYEAEEALKTPPRRRLRQNPAAAGFYFPISEAVRLPPDPQPGKLN